MFPPASMKKGAVKFHSYRVDRVAGEKAFVFVMSHEAALRLNQTELEHAMKRITDAIAPHRAIFVATQPGATMQVYEVHDPNAPAAAVVACACGGKGTHAIEPGRDRSTSSARGGRAAKARRPAGLPEGAVAPQLRGGPLEKGREPVHGKAG